ncbi:MAG: hypothetical protein U9R75_12015 [Candidatus Thermoplasmatota archaeon]|nr:hypothetical protein [Candidatus Thermoplasmatota archaeon]
MEKGNNSIEWIGRIGMGLGIAGLLFTLIPFICLVSPIFSQAGVILGIIAFMRSHKLEIKRTQLMGLVAIILGLAGLVIQTTLYLLNIKIW